jgi:hypothetical protein
MKTVPQLGLKASILAGGVMAALGGWPGAASAVEDVDLQLVLATDVSGSINNDELQLERQGIAAAFLDPEVVRGIENGALGRIAVSMLDFSSPGFGKTVIEWRIVHDRASAAAFARAILATPRTLGNRTSISDALELGAQLIASSGNDIVATRKVIDVAGDGPNNDGKPLQEIRERIMAQGIVVNGLPVMDESANGYFPGLDKYYQACVIGGRGAFAIVVRRFGDFGPAMRRKLILEISQDENAIRQAEEELSANTLLRHVAAARGTPAQPPTLLRPARNEHSNGCNVPDARLRSGNR